jgi:hypothetical protein
MKQFIFLILLLIVFKAEAQKSVTLKMRYMPGRKYQSSMALTGDVKVNMTGNEEMAEKLKAQGMTLPLSLNAAGKVNSAINTGKTGPDSNFPLTADFSVQDVSVNINGKDIDPLKGKNISVRVIGHSNADGKIIADSTFVNNKKDTAKNSSGKIADMIGRQINFPDHPLKVGDTFDQNAPMNLPGATGIMADVNTPNVHTIYKLTNIADGKAYFDLTITGEIKIPVKTVKVDLTCNGAGKMVYSIKDNFPLSVKSQVNLKINVTAGTMVIDANAAMTMENTHMIN